MGKVPLPAGMAVTSEDFSYRGDPKMGRGFGTGA